MPERRPRRCSEFGGEGRRNVASAPCRFRMLCRVPEAFPAASFYLSQDQTGRRESSLSCSSSTNESRAALSVAIPSDGAGRRDGRHHGERQMLITTCRIDLCSLSPESVQMDSANDRCRDGKDPGQAIARRDAQYRWTRAVTVLLKPSSIRQNPFFSPHPSPQPWGTESAAASKRAPRSGKH